MLYTQSLTRHEINRKYYENFTVNEYLIEQSVNIENYRGNGKLSKEKITIVSREKDKKKIRGDIK